MYQLPARSRSLSRHLGLLLALGAIIVPPSHAGIVPPDTSYALAGDQVFPESIAIDQASGRFWVGSVKDGTIFTGIVGNDAPVEVFSPAGADGRNIVTGVAFSGGRLIVLGRQSGQAFVYDAKTARLLGKTQNGLAPAETFLNDLVVTANGDIYITDSVAAVLWKFNIQNHHYTLERFIDFSGTIVRYRTAKGADGINVNGITASGDGKYLIIGKRNDNALFRIRVADKSIRRIDVAPHVLSTANGLVLSGQTLYAVENIPGSVETLTMSHDFTQVLVSRETMHASFAFPTGAALCGSRLLVVNSQFNSLGSPAAVVGTTPPVLPFRVTDMAVPGKQAAGAAAGGCVDQ
ncbi:hypothetical protein [Pinirhizobacter soli]|uniref:hypothetical protein n=1 Tax=Pinirhizobacter soli TaxID=2786953 RepID=UPI00202A1AC6|nr:hypothetical protein [Pinirhizobacter soli]